MRKYSVWLGAAAILVVIFGTIYTVVQQSQRRDANFPQVQIATDAASALDHGTNPYALTVGHVDMSQSLAPFTIIYDKSGRVAAGSGYLNGSIPTIATGVLTAANGKPYHQVTWQPNSGTRIAAVSVAADKYYVLSGRSIAEVEKNENATLWLSALGGILSLLVLGLTFMLTRRSAER